jgi:hypothetical protein
LRYFYSPLFNTPLALLVVCIFSYGLLIGSLGFYGDEWHMVYEYISRQAIGLSRYFYFDGHPTVAWIYIASFRLLGVHPFAWQVYSLFWKWLSAVSFWLVLNQLWPERKLETFFSAVIFALYPRFSMQPMAVAYFEVWLSYFALWISIYFSIRSIKSPDQFWKFTLLAIVCKIVHIFTSEYTWGAELMRPFFLWFACFPPSLRAWHERFKLVLKTSIAPLVLSIGMFVWRIFIYASPVVDRAQPRLFDGFLLKPFETLKEVLFRLLPDLVTMLFGAWANLFQPVLFDLSSRFGFIVFLLMLLSAVLLGWYARTFWLNDELVETPWKMSWVTTGFMGLLFGLIPFYVAGYFVISGEEPYNGRFTLGSLAGIALLVPAGLSFFVNSARRRLVLFAMFAGLMIGWQNHAENQFRALWQSQEKLYREMLWRAPVVRPGTVFIFDRPEPVPFLERSQTFAINALYHVPRDAPEQYPYWYFSLSDAGKLSGWRFSQEVGSLQPLVSNIVLTDGKYDASFYGNSRAALYFSYTPEQNHCLWLIEPPVAAYLHRPALVAQNSDAYILDGPSTDTAILSTILGKEQPYHHSWCYFFQKASLSRQFQNWKEIQSYWQEAEAQKLSPLHGLEYLPFIEAYAHLGDWESAFSLSRRAMRQSEDMHPVLCEQWQKFVQQTPDSEIKAATIQRFEETFLCPKE